MSKTPLFDGDILKNAFRCHTYHLLYIAGNLSYVRLYGSVRTLT